MKFAELFEQSQKKGTYAGVRFDTTTNRAFHDYLNKNKIPTAIRPDRLHTTLLYSRKHLPNYKSAGKLQPHLVGTPEKFVVWPARGVGGTGTTNCLVLQYNCPELVKRHNDLMKQHEATYDYPKFVPHVTLSYDIGDLDVSKLPNIKDTVKKITLVEEYGEDLDMDWAQNKGGKKGD